MPGQSWPGPPALQGETVLQLRVGWSVPEGQALTSHMSMLRSVLGEQGRGSVQHAWSLWWFLRALQLLGQGHRLVAAMCHRKSSRAPKL